MADRLACDRSYITALADELEARELITRTPGTDRRIKLLMLTEISRSGRDDIAHAVAERSPVFRRLDAAERRQLEPLLIQLLDDEQTAVRDP